MKVSTGRKISQASTLEIEKSQRNISIKTGHLLLRPLVTFWRFSRYYGDFIAYRR